MKQLLKYLAVLTVLAWCASEAKAWHSHTHYRYVVHGSVPAGAVPYGYYGNTGSTGTPGAYFGVPYGGYPQNMPSSYFPSAAPPTGCSGSMPGSYFYPSSAPGYYPSSAPGYYPSSAPGYYYPSAAPGYYPSATPGSPQATIGGSDVAGLLVDILRRLLASGGSGPVTTSGDVGKKLDDLTSKLSNLGTTLDTINNRLPKLELDLKKLSDKIDALSKKQGMEETGSDVDQQLNDLRTRLEVIETPRTSNQTQVNYPVEKLKKGNKTN